MWEPVGTPQRPRLVRLALVFYSALLAGAFALAFASGIPFPHASEEAALRGLEPLRGIAVGLAVGALVVLVSRELTRRTRSGDALARALGRLLGRLSGAECLLLAALSGAAEEAFFRGALQPLVGLVPASLAFGLVHFVPRREFLPWTGFAVVAGFLLGALFDATGNLIAPVVAHATVNAVNLRFLSREYGECGGGLAT
jgi:membrane protease YdiL (CAAX protease family)